MNNPAPITFLTLQLFVATILFLILRLLPTKSKNLQFQLPAIPSKTYCVALGPLLLLNLLGLSANTYTLLLLPASFYQIARGLVLPLTLITSAMLLPPSPSTRPTQNLVLACIVITVGFLVGVSPTITNPKAALKGPNALSPLGILAGLISSLSSSLHVVVIKQLTDSKHLSLPLLDFSYYSNTMTAVTLVPFIFITGEYGSFIKWFYDEKTAPKDIRNFIVGTLVTGTSLIIVTPPTNLIRLGVIGLAISLSSLISVKITSPITHMVISAVRGVVQAAVAAWLFKELIDEYEPLFL
jgi:GDP-fucose transporter C1